MSSLLFGDSITQFGTLTLQAYLQTQYIRRLDVVNRGLSGFTAPMGFRALQKFLPTTGRGASTHIKLLTVFFGANDACLPGELQHVELQSYVDTLKAIIHYPLFQQQGDRKTHVVIITPPPYNEHQCPEAPKGPFQRRAGATSQYAQAAVQAGRAYGVHILDLWTIIMRRVGWNESMGRDCCCKHLSCNLESKTTLGKSEVQHIPGCIHVSEISPNADYQLSDFLTDGLHLTKFGYDVLFWELMKLIRRDLPDCAPEKLPFVLPEWRTALAAMNSS